MVFLGYIIPEKNQKELLTDSQIAAQNEQQDIVNNAISNALKKKQLELLTSQSVQESNQSIQAAPLVPSISEEEIAKEVMNSLMPVENSPVEELGEIIEEKASPIDIAISNKIAELGRDLTAKEEIAVENDDDEEFKDTLDIVLEIPTKPQVKRGDSAESAITDFSEAPTVATTVLSTIDNKNIEKLRNYYNDSFEILKAMSNEYDKVYKDKLEEVTKKGDKNEILKLTNKIKNLKEEANPFTEDQILDIKKILLEELTKNENAIIYGARSNIVKAPSDNSTLIIDEDGELRFKSSRSGKRGPLLNDNFLRNTIHLNMIGLPLKNPEQDLTGMGLNNSKTFIDMSNNMLVVKQTAKSRSKVINRPLSPLLKRVVQNLQKTGELDVELYDLLKEPEQDAVNKIITLSKLQTPDRVRENQKDRVFNLRNRYEILLGELQAGNDGSLVKNELGEVVQRLYDIGEIKLGKKNAILSVLHS